MEVVLSTSTPSLKQDSLQEENKARREDKPSSSHLSTLWVKIQMKKNPATIHQYQGRCTTTAIGTKDAVCWVKLCRAQDQGLRFGHTKSDATIVHNPVLANCIYKVISQNGDRTLFERLSTPAPRVTLRSRWQPQQQHSESASSSVWKQMLGAK